MADKRIIQLPDTPGVNTAADEMVVDNATDGTRRIPIGRAGGVATLDGDGRLEQWNPVVVADAGLSSDAVVSGVTEYYPLTLALPELATWLVIAIVRASITGESYGAQGGYHHLVGGNSLVAAAWVPLLSNNAVTLARITQADTVKLGGRYLDDAKEYRWHANGTRIMALKVGL